MAGKRPFKFQKGGQTNQPSPAPNRAPNPNRGFEGKPDLKNEWTQFDGPFSLHAKLTKSAGYIETGVIHKKKMFNVRLHIEARGGDVSSLEAVYQAKTGDRDIKQISEKCFDAEFDVPVEQFVGTHLKVTVLCKFKIGVLKRKPLSVAVFLPH